MKAYFLLFVGTILCLSLKGFTLNGQQNRPELDMNKIHEEMELKYSLRETFKEKGNAGRYLKFHIQN